jgi:outer membrane protein OmpA-like peptidoglycan-associated protein
MTVLLVEDMNPQNQNLFSKHYQRSLNVRATHFLFSILGAVLISVGAVAAHADEVYYNPTNKASPTGYTTDYQQFRTIGCPGHELLGIPCKVPDSDGDGVLDDKDRCPNTPAGRKVNAEGCELDGDGDGVVDGLDKCPNTPAGRKVNAQGCELDSDGDGVVDGLDKCPNTPAGRKVNAEGCERDSDGDGIVDGLDKCPTLYAKTADGCPVPVAVPQKLVLGDVLFATNEATLTADAIETLDKAAASLQEWGDVKVEVAGYTDNTGTVEYNEKLSWRRADAVRTYLIDKGIAAERLTAKGYGESNPVADNATEAGRSENRRVELVPMK